jgi:hypothetical protein
LLDINSLRTKYIYLELGSPGPWGGARAGGARKVAIFAVKLLVTGACFWYISRQIDFSEVLSSIQLLDFRWAALAIFVIML